MKTARAWPRALVAASVLVLGCEAPPPTATPAPPAVSVSQPEVREVETFFEHPATLQAIRKVSLRARVPGILEKIDFRDGEVVSEGDLLFVIEQEPYRIAVEEARAAADQLRARLELAETNLERNQKMRAAKTVSEVALLEAETEFKSLQAALAEAEGALARAELNLSYTEIRAPMDGRIDAHLVDVGNLVGDGEPTLLATLVQLDPIYAFFDASEKVHLAYVEAGYDGVIDPEADRPIRLELPNEEGFPHLGQVDYVATEMSPGTRTIRVRSVFPNPTGELWPGLSARIRSVLGAPTDAILIREEAVGSDLQGRYVYVIGSEDVAERRSVTLGRRYGEMVQVTEGLTPDDTYVVSGLHRVRPGRPVQPRSASADTPG